MSDKTPENNKNPPSSAAQENKKRVREAKDSRLKQALRQNLRRRKTKHSASDQD